MFLKVPEIIIIIFGENNVLGPIYIDLRISIMGVDMGEHGSPSINLFIIHKTGKITRA